MVSIVLCICSNGFLNVSTSFWDSSAVRFNVEINPSESGKVGGCIRPSFVDIPIRLRSCSLLYRKKLCHKNWHLLAFEPRLTYIKILLGKALKKPYNTYVYGYLTHMARLDNLLSESTHLSMTNERPEYIKCKLKNMSCSCFLV